MMADNGGSDATKDKVAIITGGAHGMGEAEARLFAREGAKIVVADLLVKEGEAVAADIAAGQGQALFVPHRRDLRRPTGSA